MATYSSKKYPSSSITSAQLADGSVVAVDLADGAVTSAKILDGTIVNGDINASAAVAYSKLNLSNSIVAGDITSNAVTNAKLASTAVTPAKLANSGAELGMRNMFINGNFDIWQRSTSYTYPGGIWLYGHADRWAGHFDGGSAGTYSRSTNVPNSNSAYSMRVAGVSGGTSAYLNQRIEAVNGRAGIAAGSVTVSGWIKRTGNAASSVSLNLITPTALDNYASYNTIGNCFSANNTISGNGTASGSSMTLTTADTWYYFTMTDTSWATRTGIANGAQIYFGLGGLSTTGSYYEFSQLQIEAGPTATPFEFRHISTELALCQRYFQITNPANTSGIGAGGARGSLFGSNTAQLSYTFPVRMRAAPSVSRGGAQDTFWRSGGSGQDTASMNGGFTAYQESLVFEITSLTNPGAVGYPIVYNGQLSINAEL